MFLSFILIFNFLFTEHYLSAAEVVQVFDDAIKMSEVIDDNGNYATLLNNGEIVISDKNNKPVSHISRNASSIKVIGKGKLAVAGSGNIFLYNINDTNKQNPVQLYHTINTQLTITALTYQGDWIFFGTNTGGTFKVRMNETIIHPIPGACKTQITLLEIKNDMLVVCSLAEFTKLINLKSGFCEGLLVPGNDSKTVLTPVRALAFEPGYYSMNLAVAQGNDVLIYDASANGDSSIKRLPKKRYDLGAPVMSVGYNGTRFIMAGMYNNSVKLIDAERTDNRGNHVILTRTGYTAGSVMTLMTQTSGAILAGAGRNLYMEASSGSGKIIPVNTTDIKKSVYITLILKYEDEYKTEIKKEFRFPDYYNSNAWTVPEGTASISTSTQNVVIENEKLTIEGATPVSVNLRIIEREEPEKPRPIAVRIPDLPLIPANFIERSGRYSVSLHKNQLLVWEKDSCRVIPLPEIPYLVKTDKEKVLAAFTNKLMIYSCSNGAALTTISFADRITHLRYKNDVIAAATTANAVTVIINNKIAAKIPQENDITSIDLSEDGKFVVIAAGRMIRMFETQTGAEVPMHTTPRRAQISHVVFSPPANQHPSARYFLTLTTDGAARLHDISGLDLNEFNLGGQVDYIRFDGTNRLIIKETAKNTVRCVNFITGMNQYTINIEGSVFAVMSEATIAFVNNSGQIVLRKNGGDLAKIGLTQNNKWYFTSLHGDYPVLFRAEQSLIPLFTAEDGRLLSPAEIEIYMTAKLPL